MMRRSALRGCGASRLLNTGVSVVPAVRSGVQGTVGNTPLINIPSLSALTGCEILGKAEFLEPGGSVKDRAAAWLVADAEANGLLAGGTIVEGTAGNTGIGLAHICRAKGYELVIYMPDTQSQEKMDLRKPMLPLLLPPLPPPLLTATAPLSDSAHPRRRRAPGPRGALHEPAELQPAGAGVRGRGAGHAVLDGPVRQPREHAEPLREHGPGAARADAGVRWNDLLVTAPVVAPAPAPPSSCC